MERRVLRWILIATALLIALGFFYALGKDRPVTSSTSQSQQLAD